MPNKVAIPTDLVRKLGKLDKRFFEEYCDDLEDADDFPYWVLSAFEGFLARNYKGLMAENLPLLFSTMDIFEGGLAQHYDLLQNMIEVSFIEKLFYDNEELFKWMIDNCGPKLKYEMLSFQTKERGYRIINSIKETFANPPDSLGTLMKNDLFIKKLEYLGVPHDNSNIFDAWGKPYDFQVCSPAQNESTNSLICITSLATSRGYGKNEQAIG